MAQHNYNNMILTENFTSEFIAVGFVDYSSSTNEKEGVYNYPIKTSNLSHLATRHCMVNLNTHPHLQGQNIGIGLSTKKTTCRTNVMLRDPNTGRFMSWKKLVAAGYTQFDLSQIPAFPTA